MRVTLSLRTLARLRLLSTTELPLAIVRLPRTRRNFVISNTLVAPTQLSTMSTLRVLPPMLIEWFFVWPAALNVSLNTVGAAWQL